MKPPVPTMPATIVLVLLVYFGLALFGKRIGIEIDATSPLAQTLINLTIAAASYFIGTSQGSAKKDDVIAAMPPAPLAPIKIDDSIPVKVEETKP